MERTFKKVHLPSIYNSKRSQDKIVVIKESPVKDGVVLIHIEEGKDKSMGIAISRTDARLLRDTLNNILEVPHKPPKPILK